MPHPVAGAVGRGRCGGAGGVRLDVCGGAPLGRIAHSPCLWPRCRGGRGGSGGGGSAGVRPFLAATGRCSDRERSYEMHIMYFTEQPMSAYPEDAATDEVSI